MCAKAMARWGQYLARREPGYRRMRAAVSSGQPEAMSLRATRQDTVAYKLDTDETIIELSSTELRPGDKLVVEAGQVIPTAEVGRLFQPFHRLGPRRARRDGGHGLGLSIVGAIATAHGAVITPQPRPGGGLAIDVTFPSPVTGPGGVAEAPLAGEVA